MVVGYVTHVVKGLNQSLSECGLSTIISPTTLLMGLPGPKYHQIKKLKFGDYVQVYTVKIRMYTNTARSVVSIVLYPSWNIQGG